MVYEKYIKRGGKVFGPYYYESYREGEKIYKRYLGTELPKKKNVTAHNNRWIFLVLSLVVLLGMFYLFQANLTTTGEAFLDIKSKYEAGEYLSGTLKFNLKEGELIPRDAKVKINFGNEIKEIFLSELVSEGVVSGNYFAEGAGISGEGEGYGIAGEKISYPNVNFELRVFGSGEIIPEPSKTPSETPSESPSETPVESPSPMPSEIPTPTPSEIPVETLTPIPSETPSESPFQEQSETSIEKKEEKEEEKSETPAPQASEQSAVTEPQQEGSITGSIVSENEQIVAGKASKGNDFEYNFGEGERAEIISGSVKVKDNAIGDGNIKLKVNKEKAEVSTEYSIVEKGFGEEVKMKRVLNKFDSEKELNEKPCFSHRPKFEKQGAHEGKPSLDLNLAII